MTDNSNLYELDLLLQKILDESVSEKQKGTFFENLVLGFFRNEPYYREEYPQVWHYADWASLHGINQHDLGIDLVASVAGHKGKFCAIQCKIYQENYYLKKHDIDSFLAHSGKKVFIQRILVTTGLIGPNSMEALDEQGIKCNIIDRSALGKSILDWSRFSMESGSGAVRDKKKLRPYQETALADVIRGFDKHDRGILVMACGTGKTLLSLRIAEKSVGAGGFVLYMVPSLALLSQVLTEWTQESLIPLHSYAVCSDSDVGRIKSEQTDGYLIRLHELQYGATTTPEALARAITARKDKSHLSVVFSTYHSIDVLTKAQKLGVPEFDMALCDEAHRTTGSKSEEDQAESAFVRIHKDEYVKVKKRLYMTATPRIFKVNERARKNAESDTVVLYSMDDQEMFGPVFHSLPFTTAVKEDILVDYKVLVLSMDERLVNRQLKELLSDPENSLVVSDAAKIIGCFKALAKHGLKDDMALSDLTPMKRAVAFCQVIEPKTGRTSKGMSTHKVSSKLIEAMFPKVVEDYLQNSDEPDWLKKLKCETKHVDGTMPATIKSEKLNWLRENPPEDTCRILTNVRCLSEGVDVPALDGVLFLAPRKSMVEVVQSVGRVMRKAEGKKFGYVVLPIVIPADMEPHEALDNSKVYSVVWQVLQALRSHDNSFDSLINKLKFMEGTSGKIDIVTFFDKSRTSHDTEHPNTGTYDLNLSGTGLPTTNPLFTSLDEETFNRAIVARLVKKVGKPDYLGEWAEDVVRIAKTYIDRIKAILEDPQNTKEIKIFNQFFEELKDDLNDSLTQDEVIEMLAQHMITGPAFEAVFENSSFVKQNPVSKSIEKVLDAFKDQHLEKEAVGLDGFYLSVKKEVEDMQDKVSGIDNILGKQKIIVELYEKFFSRAFPKMTQRLGIVYTPVEIVDFILKSVNELLQNEFGVSLGSKNVNIIDPFTGTGTFITRLLQSGLITKKDLPYKYNHEIHANEIVLLAYYIASINIESVYHEITGKEYEPFPGICLTDTFQLYEKDDLISRYLEDNSTRRKKQKKLHLRVIIGNPPYSIGQTLENDNNKNVNYPLLDAQIKDTYIKNSNAVLSKGVHDSYVRAFRWASDRLENNIDGIIAFITNSGYIDKQAMDGLRKSLANDFQKIFVFNLRGDIRKDMLSGQKKEGENIFGKKTMTGVAITFLVKNANIKQTSKIYYHDIGDSLAYSEKLNIIKSFGSLKGIIDVGQFENIIPDEFGDWVNQRNNDFFLNIAMGDKKDKTSVKLFDNYSLGISTNKDSWCYNFSRPNLIKHIKNLIDLYNYERIRFHKEFPKIQRSNAKKIISNFVSNDETKISWSDDLKSQLIRNNELSFNKNSIVKSLYRPFTKLWMYFNCELNDRVNQIPQIFPEQNYENVAICVAGKGARSPFSVLVTNDIPNLHTIDTSQCFPFYLYDSYDSDQTGLFELHDSKLKYNKLQAITKEGLKYFQDAYPNIKIKALDLFNYIYGILHSSDYREIFANNLTKELPRIPKVKNSDDFMAFSEAGKELIKLHIHYDNVRKYPVDIITTGKLNDDDYYVTRMKFKQHGIDKDLTSIIYNPKITIKGIPLRAYDYIISGKSPIAWVMKYQGVTTDPKSGIVNDANLWATETMGNPKYPLELLQRVITVSLETLDIVNNLPKLRLK